MRTIKATLVSYLVAATAYGPWAFAQPIQTPSRANGFANSDHSASTKQSAALTVMSNLCISGSPIALLIASTCFAIPATSFEQSRRPT